MERVPPRRPFSGKVVLFVRIVARRRVTARELRLASGLALGAFILCHFLNHALGLVSVRAMEAARPFLSAPWRTLPGTVLLYGSLAVHFALTLASLYERRTLRMSVKEAGQTALGLALPFLLIGHVVGTRIDFALTGTEATYPAIVESLWVRNPLNGARQILALFVAWLHVCFGLFFWLRVKPAFAVWQPYLLAVGLLVPMLSALGFVSAGKEIAAQGAPVVQRVGETPDWIAPAIGTAFAVPIGLVLVARSLRAARRRRDRIRIGYPDGRSVDVPRGYSILEASRSARIPHQSVCGGRARCSTCRVEILHGANGQPAPDAVERATLKRIGAGPRVRLACQFRPTRDVEVIPLVDAGVQTGVRLGAALLDVHPAAFGEEREIVVMFCDIRGFTRLSEHRLPFDVVFILNRYFELVGRAVTDNGGVVDKFVGDGAMALFGLSVPPATAAAQALAAAERIIADLRDLNETLKRELIEPLRVAVALHQGPAIIGEIGYGATASLTAVGDTINVASRLEAAAKAADAELLVSDEVMRRSDISIDGFELKILDVRGRSRPLEVWVRSATRPN